MRLLVTLACFAALAAGQPAFEVTSVKPNKTATAIGNRFEPQRIRWTGIPLRDLIAQVYGLQEYQIFGAPAWTSTDRWDIEGKVDSPAGYAAKNEMMKTLLTDRFHLAIHTETREMPEYRLEIAKGGPRLQKATTEEPGRAGMVVQKGLLEGKQTNMANLAFWLKNQLGRPVLDNTALTGDYNFRIEWVPDESQPNSGFEVPTADATTAGPPIFTALQALGLKLVPFKGPVSALVIDHVEKPDGN